MLKHEEMIENVHRRIAEYEEAKKMKHSAFKNIFSAIKPNTNNKNANGSEEVYTEAASGTERLRPTKRMLRAAPKMFFIMKPFVYATALAKSVQERLLIFLKKQL